MSNPLEKQEGGTHYKKYDPQPIEAAIGDSLSWAFGEIFVKVVRYLDKGGEEDLKKCLHQIEILRALQDKPQVSLREFSSRNSGKLSINQRYAIQKIDNLNSMGLRPDSKGYQRELKSLEDTIMLMIKEIEHGEN